MSVTTSQARFKILIASSSAGAEVQNPQSLIGSNTGICVLSIDSLDDDTFVTIGGVLNAVPTASFVKSARLWYQAYKSSADPELEITASIGGTIYTNKRSITNTVNANYYEDIPLGAGANYNSVDQAQVTFRVTGSGTPQVVLTGVNGAAKRPGLQITYEPLRWARVLTSGSNFPVTTLTSETFNEIPQSNLFVNRLTTVNSQGHFKNTASIEYRNYTNDTPEFFLKKTNQSRSLYVSESTITCSNIPQTITIPDSGDYQSDVLFVEQRNQGGIGKPFGRTVKSPLIGIENVLTYEGAMSAFGNSTIGTGSQTAPFIPIAGTQTENGIVLPGSLIKFLGPNSDDVGYADYNTFSNDFIRIEFTSPKNNDPNNPQFFVTASFEIPYSASFSAPCGLDAYIVRKFNIYQDAIEYGPFSVVFTGGGGPNPIGMLTGSAIIPGLSNDFLEEGEHIQLRVQNQNASKPIHIAFTGSGGANFGLSNEFNANLKPSVHIDFPVIVQGAGGFVGEPWSESTASLSGVVSEPIPPGQALYLGDGLIFNRTPPTPANSAHTSLFTGTQAVTASVKLNGQDQDGEIDQDFNPGLTFARINNPTSTIPFSTLAAGRYSPMVDGNFNCLVLTGSLAGNGLSFQSTTRDDLFVELSGSRPGLKLSGPDANNILLSLQDSIQVVTPSIGGDGLDYTSGILKVDRASNSGLQFDNAKLELNDFLTGKGLEFSGGGTNKNIINLDLTQFITGSAIITASVAPGSGLVTGPLFIGNVTPSTSNAVANLRYNPGQGGLNDTKVTIEYGYINQMFHSTLASISGSTLKINGNITLGDAFDVDTVMINSDQLKLSSSFPQLNRVSNYNLPPHNELRGGFIIPTDTATPTTGAAIFYDSAVNGNPFVDWEYQELSALGWVLTTGSAVKKLTENTNPFNPGNSVNTKSNPTSSFQHSDYTALPQTAKLIDGISVASDPNAVAPEVTLYQTESMVNYGAICVVSFPGVIDDSNVWMYVPESTL